MRKYIYGGDQHESYNILDCGICQFLCIYDIVFVCIRIRRHFHSADAGGRRYRMGAVWDRLGKIFVLRVGLLKQGLFSFLYELRIR